MFKEVPAWFTNAWIILETTEVEFGGDRLAILILMNQ